jgi:glycosyltransferase involved in cell wall biosynthesis
VISHTSHHRDGSRVVGWGPTVREIDALAGAFEHVVHVAMFHDGPAPASEIAYEAANVEVVGLRPAGGRSLSAKAGTLLRVPGWFVAIRRELRRCDVVQVRAPANVALIALVMLVIARRPRLRWAKYAGDWSKGREGPLASRFQRWMLRRGWPRGPVTVNGRFPSDPGHVHGFVNPCLTAAEIAQGAAAAQRRTFDGTLHLMFVGRVERAKGIHFVLDLCDLLNARSVRFTLEVVGEGPALAEARVRAAGAPWGEGARFHGWLTRAAVDDIYRRANVLLLPSATEGWPKVLSEAMAFGVVPIASRVSSIPQIMEETGAGLSLPLDLDEWLAVFAGLAADPARLARLGSAGVATAERFTYEAYLRDLDVIFRSEWGVGLASLEPAGEVDA